MKKGQYCPFGERLSELMEKNGYSQKKLAETIGVNVKTVKRHLYGEVYPDYEILERYCDLFKCSADYLIGRTDRISMITGLSNDAILTLVTYHLNGMNTGFIDMLSDIITDKKKRDAIWLMYDALLGYKE